MIPTPLDPEPVLEGLGLLSGNETWGAEPPFDPGRSVGSERGGEPGFEEKPEDTDIGEPGATPRLVPESNITGPDAPLTTALAFGVESTLDGLTLLDSGPCCVVRPCSGGAGLPPLALVALFIPSGTFGALDCFAISALSGLPVR